MPAEDPSAAWAVPPGLSNLRMVSIQGQSQVRQPARCRPLPSSSCHGARGTCTWASRQEDLAGRYHLGKDTARHGVTDRPPGIRTHPQDACILGPPPTQP